MYYRIKDLCIKLVIKTNLYYDARSEKHQITHLFSLTVHRFSFNSINYPYMYATCFGLYLGHPQACQYKNRTKEEICNVKVRVIK
jgi:hypothetical protein